MTSVAMLLGHDLVEPNLDFRVYREATSLIKAGYDVSVICWARRTTKELPAEADYQDIHLKRVFQSLDGGLLKRILGFRKAMEKLSVLAEAGDYAILHAHDLETLPAAMKAARNSGAKVIFDSHEDWPLMERVQNRWVGAWMQRQQNKWMPQAAAILTVSPELAARLESQLPEQAKVRLAGSVVSAPSLVPKEEDGNIDAKAEAHLAGSADTRDSIVSKSITVLYNSEPEKSYMIADRMALLVELKEGEVNLGYIGGLRKDIIEQLIQAVAPIEKTHLLVIGGPPKGQAGYESLIEDLKSYATDKGAKVSFTGALQYHSMPNYYNTCDIILVGHYVHPRLRPYAIPKKMLDGMAHGKPVIAGPYPARQRILDQFQCGLTIQQDTDPHTGTTIDHWSEAIQKLVDDPDLRKRLGDNGHKAFKEHFCWEKQAEKLVQVYQKLA